MEQIGTATLIVKSPGHRGVNQDLMEENKLESGERAAHEASERV